MNKEKCCICGRDFEQKYGNNALPIKDGRCCTKCDYEVVIPERIRRMKEGKPVY